MTLNNERDDWWKQAVVYQIYPRSFKDADGDGLGDIPGVTSKIDYLKDLGVDALWLSPFYPSDLADGGYDVIDYRDVDPRLGTMDDFDAMAAAAHEAGMKIMVDIVPNHTADKHVLFQEALQAGRGSAARDRYIFREGRGEHGELPPNDWVSLFGGSAWEQVEDGQWYLHIFAKEQPDLNWQHPDVHEEFKKTLRFWSDHGTDGFRVDVAHGLAKDLESAPLEELGKRYPVHATFNHDGKHPLWDRTEVHEIYHEWREVFNEYDPPRFAVGEAWVVPEHQHLYASPDELGQVFNFEFAKANWTVAQFREAILDGLNSAEQTKGSTTTWVMNNHDVPRGASRYGLPQVDATAYHQFVHDWILRDGKSYFEDRELGTRRARAAILMEAGLPGSLYVYQGEELGLFEVADIPWDKLEDPTPFFTRRNFTEKGRDGCRVPLPWDSADAPEPAGWDANFGEKRSFGFSPATLDDGKAPAEPHLPQPLWFKDYAVDVESGNPDSMLTLYREALKERASLLTATADTSCQMLDSGDDVIAYSRPSVDGRRFVSLTNFGTEEVDIPRGDIVLASAPVPTGKLPQDTSVWVLLDV
ncbi:glycoside hydrolase family 13 protein [Bifidobacterium tibiigranuli]|jgi:alpha-glucosidase|uniref:glycoside hydrolase family 13 protein n=1 Tax=Bifidobacterium tibiigranuli TaxID=2172043 RepID=UPI0026EDDC26|nr:glycoside hydrolase family 13 protein [Bifidobacterium tibiigranuli]MCI1649050.1 glycoside hydrolase family 13 protein [Bifidobacterium tibiigranuli]MCI2186285.1 glycoside hydrolase family 13 protein [Bifidobacterium tibiigranuli]MCI2203889.1 glycoside hydrolase family 13 protein [Bifidobacterium tibiigranuli]